MGEFIIQLRNEKPAHIITPAVHLRRKQVGELFHEKLGIPFTDDIPTLTAAARSTLREVFLNADIGVSGVNFGVAQSGTLCVVTNEGNGRMCTSIPRVHIALMGMERLLPSLDDLALFLSLLPRSATGQNLSVYTQLIHQPENSQEKHLIILDNGRSSVRNSSLQEILYCIRCGSCLNVCPIFREIGGHGYIGANGAVAPYPGPIGSVISPGLLGSNFSQLAQACTLCGACKEACPVDIDLPKLLLRVRAGKIPDPPAEKHQPSKLEYGLKIYSSISSKPRMFKLASRFVGLASNILPGYLHLPTLTGWGLSKDLARPAARSFRVDYREEDSKSKDEDFPQQISRPKKRDAGPVAQNREENAGKNALIERFDLELITLGGSVHRIRSQELQSAILRFLNDREIQHVQSWNDLPLKFGDALRQNDIEVSSVHSASIRAGITGALAGIAETGSLVIPGGEGRPLSASLVPEIHLAIIDSTCLVSSLEEALRLPEIVKAPATVIVTGPSRTADIEMTLTIGVHGPKELHVFLVDG